MIQSFSENVRATSQNLQCNHSKPRRQETSSPEVFQKSDSESLGGGIYGRMTFAKQGERSPGDVGPMLPAEIAVNACCG